MSFSSSPSFLGSFLRRPSLSPPLSHPLSSSDLSTSTSLAPKITTTTTTTTTHRFWIFYRCYHDGDTLLFGHAPHFEHDDNHGEEGGHDKKH
jgi:hypothetical protein